MTRFVLDSPTLLHLVTQPVAVDAAHQLVAPASIRSRSLDLLLARVRRGELDAGAALELHDRLTEVKLRLLDDRVSRRVAWKLALDHGWDSIVDAQHLALVRLQADALVTVDERLAALARGIVPVAPASALQEP